MMKKVLILLTMIAVNSAMDAGETVNSTSMNQINDMKEAKATFGGGCFWCTEAIYERVNGVLSVVSGYSGGSMKNPSYKQVCSGETGHAEVVQITYDPSIVSYYELLEIFFKTHDPTTLNRQGADVGTQYRSVVFYHNEKQKEQAEEIIAALEGEKIWKSPVVTEISPLMEFYEAEDYHQEYFDNNSSQPYCSAVIQPKIDKFSKIFREKLK